MMGTKIKPLWLKSRKKSRSMILKRWGHQPTQSGRAIRWDSGLCLTDPRVDKTSASCTVEYCSQYCLGVLYPALSSFSPDWSMILVVVLLVLTKSPYLKLSVTKLSKRRLQSPQSLQWDSTPRFKSTLLLLSWYFQAGNSSSFWISLKTYHSKLKLPTSKPVFARMVPTSMKMHLLSFPRRLPKKPTWFVQEWVTKLVNFTWDCSKCWQASL